MDKNIINKGISKNKLQNEHSNNISKELNNMKTIKEKERTSKENNNQISNNLRKINSKKNILKILKYHIGPVYHLCKLKDGRLASCSGDKTIKIYNKITFDLELSIFEHSGLIYSFTQLENGKIISCSLDKTMKLINLINNDKYEIEQTLIGHYDSVCKVIEIKQNELISISYDGIMKIWILNNKNKFECISNIIFQKKGWTPYCNILKLNNNEFATSSYIDEYIKFWNSNNYSNIITLYNIINTWTQENMCLLNDNLLCVGGSDSKGFYLIQISNHQIIKNILGPNEILSIYKCCNDIILCSINDENKNHSLIKYKFENLNLVKVFEKEKAHNFYIWTCFEFNNEIIVSGGEDFLIKLWI